MSSDYSATDIITFIGVPLAVLGVLPILYNTIATLAALSRVRRMLKKSRLAGITRGDIINHVIEAELPRFTIAPLDREEHGAEYWNVYDHPSVIPGGSWTIFNWKMHTIGIKTQRIEYADQLRQPQAEIGFEELVSYLIDLGAVPSANGFRMLRTAGLWVPIGTPLLLSPDRQEAVLTIAPLDDSDGHLSLAVKWSRKWLMRSTESLPPYWSRIVAPTEGSKSLLDRSGTVSTVGDESVIYESGSGEEKLQNSLILPRPSDLLSSKESITAIRCHISMEGLVDAMIENNASRPSEHVSVRHLEIRDHHSSTTGVWFASAATALGSSSHTVLWNYHIPEDMLSLARKNTVPCGILVILEIIEESATPEWATKYDDEAEEIELKFKRMREDSAARMRDMKLSPAEQSANFHERARKQHEDWREDLRRIERRNVHRAETRITEAVQSQQWDVKVVSEHNLNWLKKQKYVEEDWDTPRAVELVLFRMIKDQAFAENLTKILDAWKSWVDGGGMRKADYLIVKESKELFAYASLILSIIRDSTTAVHGSLATDLQESIKIWKKVRLG